MRVARSALRASELRGDRERRAVAEGARIAVDDAG